MRRIHSPDRSLVAHEAGPSVGRPVLLLHGFPDLPRGFHPLMARFAAAGRRTVAPYLRGYAPSATGGITRFDVLAEDLLAWADGISPGEPVDLVGHDWGSVIAQRACLLWPRRFRRLCLMSVPHLSALSAGVARRPDQLWRSRYMVHFQAGRLADAWVRADRYRYIRRLWRRWSPSLRLEDDYFDELATCFEASWPAPVSYYRVARKRGRFPFDMVWSPDRVRDAIGVPTLYLHGERDGCIAPSLARGQARFFAASYDERVFAGLGHFLHVEDPDAVFSAMGPFFGSP